MSRPSASDRPGSPSSFDEAEHAASVAAEFYNEVYYGRLARHNAWRDWHSQLVAKRLGNLAGKRVLDVACGTGEWLATLHRRGAVVSGVDISQVAIDVAKKRLPAAQLQVSTAEKLPFETSAFDVVTCLGSLEHFPDQPAALQEMSRVAKDGATILILVPNAGFLTRRFGFFKGTEQTAVRETVRTITEWEALLTSADLNVAARWRDLHVANWRWISSGKVRYWPLRAMQALALILWPVCWQYQVYFCCTRSHRPE